ncbi:MAG TPA: hypothetical protein VJB95_02025 [Candidatus Paceibacterota bacterium]
MPKIKLFVALALALAVFISPDSVRAAIIDLDVSISGNTLLINSCGSQLRPYIGYKGYVNDVEVMTTGFYGGLPCYNGDVFIQDLTQFLRSYGDVKTIRYDFYIATDFSSPLYATFTVYYYGSSFTLTPPPPAPECTVNCFSNVLFLPGIKGSVLQTSNDVLWPPTTSWSNDIPQLALNDAGESVNAVYVNGVLNEFYGTDVYLPFSEFMDGLVSEGLIQEWLPLAYDWRYSPEKILADGIKTEHSTLDVLDEIQKLAEHSRTGKVSIVAHSMGGLLGKTIIKKLEEEGKSNLIESFIMVGTPQLGTPQAAAVFLHGDHEGILGGFIVDASEMRAIGRNMPGAYNLLPSPRYFNEVADKVIEFDPTASFTDTWRVLWGETIDNFTEFTSFLAAEGAPRDRPAENILTSPEVLRRDLLDGAYAFHNTYDHYQIPVDIRVVQIAGWGMPTVKGVKYKLMHQTPSYEVEYTVEGDKTVVYPSAVSSMTDETYYFDLAVYNALENFPDSQHRSLLNTFPMQSVVKKIIEQGEISNNSIINDTKPDPGSIYDKLIISIHSPVILGAYDQLGNFTGVEQNQDLSADIWSVKENIPGSSFLQTAEGQYIFVPKEGTYNFVYRGIGDGPTTVRIDNFSIDVMTTLAEYSDISTTIDTRTAFSVSATQPEETILQIDYNTDGKIDDSLYADDYQFTLAQLLEILKNKVSSLDAKDQVKKQLLKKVENLEKKINSNKTKKLDKKLSKLIKDIIKKGKKGKLDSQSTEKLINLIEQIEGVI